VLSYLQEPRTRAELLAHFGDERALWSAWNLAKRGYVKNIACGDGLTRWQALIQPRGTGTTSSTSTGIDLQAAWLARPNV